MTFKFHFLLLGGLISLCLADVAYAQLMPKTKAVGYHAAGNTP